MVNIKIICAALVLSGFLNGCAYFQVNDTVSAKNNNSSVLLTDLTKPVAHRTYLLSDQAGI